MVEPDIQQVAEQLFLSVDIDNDGRVDLEDMLEAMVAMNSDMPKEDLREFLTHMNPAGDGVIKREDFIDGSAILFDDPRNTTLNTTLGSDDLSDLSDEDTKLQKKGVPPTNGGTRVTRSKSPRKRSEPMGNGKSPLTEEKPLAEILDTYDAVDKLPDGSNLVSRNKGLIRRNTALQSHVDRLVNEQERLQQQIEDVNKTVQVYHQLVESQERQLKSRKDQIAQLEREKQEMVLRITELHQSELGHIQLIKKKRQRP